MFAAALVLADHVLLWIGVPFEPPVRVVHDPNVSRRDVSLEYDVEFRTNSEGLRSPEIPLDPADPGEVRVAFAGDSFVEGLGVPAEQTFCSLLDGRLDSPGRPVRVVNLGLRGTGPIEAVRAALRVGLRYHPDLVVFVIYGNDLLAVPAEGGVGVEPDGDGGWRVTGDRSLPPPAGVLKRAFAAALPWTSRKVRWWLRERLWERQRELPLVDVVEGEARRRGIPEARIRRWEESLPPELVEAADEGRFNGSYLSQGLLRSDSYAQMITMSNDSTRRRFEALSELLNQARDALRAEDVRMAVAYAPLPLQHDAKIWPFFRRVGIVVKDEWRTTDSRFETALSDWADSADVPFLTLTPAFRAASREAPGSLNFPLDGHWNAAGHSLAAKEIAAWLAAKGLL